MRLKSLIAKPVRRLLAEAGYDLVNLSAKAEYDSWLDNFGHDPFRDIRRLNEKCGGRDILVCLNVGRSSFPAALVRRDRRPVSSSK
jgi:hypothetical protein